ncbi:MAG: energy-coupling factor transporter transmembrane protein EcfT [Thermoprotei archaeon]|nr:MAG: energy-coupling factor transporter transmembrane protein EcfT [Thermoprotei archaeon]
MNKPCVALAFLYTLTATVLAFLYRSGTSLLVVALVNALLGFPLGFKRCRFVFLLLLLAIWGVFLNSLLVANTGEAVLQTWFLTIRSGVFEAVARIGARLITIAGAALFFVSLYTPREIVKGLEAELMLPKIISFPLAYGLRLLPVLAKDWNEVKTSRKQRGYRTVPLTPSDIASYLQPILSLSIERALWTGIAIELRGFHSRRPRRVEIRLSLPDYLLVFLLVFQLSLPILYP